jgi:hypothetical protein
MLGDDYAASFYPRQPGMRNLQLTLSRRVEGQTRSETVTLQPDSVDLGDAVDGQVIELRVDPEDFSRALASISR